MGYGLKKNMLNDPDRNNQLRHREQMQKLSHLEGTLINVMKQLVGYLDGKTTKTEVINQLQSIGTPDVAHVVRAIEKLDSSVQNKSIDLSGIAQGFKALEAQLKLIPKDHPTIPEQKDQVSVMNLGELEKHFATLEKAIGKIKLTAEAPKVDVKVPQTKINVEKPDLEPIRSTMMQVLHAIQTLKFPEHKPTDLSGVRADLKGLSDWFGLLEDQQKEANKKLQKLVDKPVSSGGGGGGGPVFKDTVGNLAYPSLNPNGSVITSDADLAVQIEESGSITYIGKAAPGSLASDEVWQIKKIDETSGTSITWASGNANFINAWSDRATLTYS